ncbi:EAL domain-containing protein [Evansella clarkii]|uniref:bifunctional diguanylate cyclase/phosphodiesterase n=1 Tax=Evansella clarkii TaxID=79879 RepID=UPI000997D9CF|nr:EAL domain-containing protein [Evansella clarkii]
MTLNIPDTKLLKSQNIILEMIATGESLMSILERVTVEIESIFKDTYCSIMICDEAENILADTVAPSLDDSYKRAVKGIKIAPHSGSCGTAAYRKERVIVKDITKDPLWNEFQSLGVSHGLRSCWSEPILSSEGKILGTFALYHSFPNEPSADDVQIIETFTYITAMALEHKKTDEKLSESERHYRLLADNVSDFIGIVDLEGNYVYVSPSHEKYLGYSSLELLGKNCFEFMHPDDINFVVEAFEESLKTNQQEHQAVFRFKHKKGHWVYLDTKGNPIGDNNQGITHFAYITRDVTNQKKAEQQLEEVIEDLQETQEKFDSLFNNSLDAIFEIDEVGNYARVNNVAEKLTGYSKQELLRMHFNNLMLFKEEAEEVFRKVKDGQSFRFENWLIHKEGHHLFIDVNVVPVSYKDNSCTVLAFVQDITEKKQAVEEIRELAYKDALTGLPNRSLFKLKLEEAINRADENSSSLGILFIDFDNFKSINDTLGHDFGDELLKKLVEIMKSCIGDEDILSRQGGDEFLILTEQAGISEMRTLCRTIINELTMPVELYGNEVFITPSIGVCMYPEYKVNAVNLIKNADLAMYHAKDTGKNKYQFYTEHLHEKVMRRNQLVSSLRKALHRKEFSLHYQPQFELETSKITGLEALLRWKPEFGTVSPAEFIPLSEETGMIVDIGEWVLYEACIQGKAWHDAGILNAPVSVNVSARQFMDPDFTEMVTRILKETGLQPHCLELEITERILMDVNEAADSVNKLRESGVRIAIDDFGIGYSSLNMIKIIDIDSLKIDQSFLRDVMKNSKSAGLLDTIIRIGTEIGSDVIVEGIETEDQVNFLKQKGVIGQGYYYSKPLPAEEIEGFLRRTKAGE